MDRQKHQGEDKIKRNEQSPVMEYRLAELLANSPKGAFKLHAEDNYWLGGPLVEKTSR